MPVPIPAFDSMNKAALISQWKTHMEGKLVRLQAEQDSARGATRVDGDHRPANRGERAAVSAQGYLAHGLAQRMAEISEQLRVLDLMGADARDQVVTGAVVELEDEAGERVRIAVFPGGDATVLATEGGGVRVLSLSSPWVQRLKNLEVGDGAELPGSGGAGEVDVEVVEIW